MDWTVYSIDATRGILEDENVISPNDTRMSVGWKSESSQRPAEATSWMPSPEPHPFMWDGGYVERGDEA